jgi:hypothetical protein
MSNNPEAIETKVTIENPDVGEEADDVMEMKAISGSGLAQPPTIKVKLMTCFHKFFHQYFEKANKFLIGQKRQFFLSSEHLRISK